MVHVLQRVGVNLAFTSQSDVARVVLGVDGGNMRVSEVRHAVRVKVDERGTVAGAATYVGIPAGVPPPPFLMRIDRPFLFFVHAAASDAILFARVVRQPP
jgi:serine protease inhibitor